MRSERLLAWLGILFLVIGIALAAFPSGAPRTSILPVLMWNGLPFVVLGIVLLVLSYTRTREDRAQGLVRG